MRVGSIQQVKVDYYTQYICKIQILKIWTEKLGSITDRDATQEGYKNKEDFLRAFHEINKTDVEKIPTTNNKTIFAIKFSLFIESSQFLGNFFPNKDSFKIVVKNCIDFLETVDLENESLFFHSGFKDFPTWREFIEIVSETIHLDITQNTTSILKKWESINFLAVYRKTAFFDLPSNVFLEIRKLFLLLHDSVNLIN